MRSWDKRLAEHMQKPSFSIVVPTFQRREVVCDALRAINRLSYSGKLEVLIVVDGSTDGSFAALEQIGSPFPFQVIMQHNAGAATARNRGAAAATGDILLFLDDDMICAPDLVEQHALSYLGGADAVLGHIPLDSGSVPGFLSAAVGDWARERGKRLAAGGKLTLFDLLTGQLSIRRSAFEEIGGFDGKFTLDGSFGNEDLDLGTRLLEHFDVRFNAEAVSYQRYVVTYQQNMNQWYQAGQADVAFARKHPERTEELFKLHGFSSRRTRFVTMPLSRLPFLPRIASRLASFLAQQFWGKLKPLDRGIAGFFFWTRDVLYWSGVHSSGGIPGDNPVLVLCYHAIQDLSHDPTLKPYGTPAPRFKAQIARLKRHGAQFITPEEFHNYLQGKNGVPRKAVLLTFDDCFFELGEIARAVLHPQHIPALAFAVSGLRTNEWDQAIGCMKLELLGSNELIELQNLGVEIGCHSMTHPELPKLSTQQLKEETAGAAQQLADNGIRPSRYFAYPYGESDADSRRAVQAAGFQAAFGLNRKMVTRTDDHLDLPRVEILEQDRGWRFWLKTTLPRLSRYIA